jgi:putative MFS transporter
MDPVIGSRCSVSSRLDRLPICSYHRYLTGALGFVFFFEYTDINTLSYASPAIVRYWHVPLSTIAALVSVTFLGMFIGATAGGWVGDRFGRKRALLATTVWYTGFSLLNGLAWNVGSLMIARLFTGAGISAMTVVGIAYISEIYPARVHGAYQGWIMAIGLCGVPVTAFVARFCVPLAPWGWRIVFIWGAVGILFPLIARSMEESPRWYEAQGRLEEADAVMDRIEEQVRRDCGTLPLVVTTVVPYAAPQAGHRELFALSHRSSTILLVSAWVFGTLGFFGFTSWVPTLLVTHGFSIVRSLTWSSVMASACIPGAGIAALISDRRERKGSIVIVCLLIAVCGVLYGMALGASTIVLFGVLVEMLIHVFTPLMYTYTAEGFDYAIRNSGTGLAYGAGRLANVVGPLIIAFLFTRYGYTSVFLYISGTWIAVAAVVGFFGPRHRELG